MSRSSARPDPRPQTLLRRQVQPVWSALDQSLSSQLEGGVLLAISGGRDSSVLLEACARWSGRFAGRIEVASVDHAHREGARAEAERVVARAHALGFEATVLVAGGGLRTDEAALRGRRYGSLQAHARQRALGTVATAHHATDDAEGLLMHLLGTGGGSGGRGMPAQRAMGTGQAHEDPVVLVRPLLALSRERIDLAAAGLQLRQRLIDSADDRGVGARAQVRRDLLPIAERLRPGTARRLADLAQRRREDEEALVYAASQLVRRLPRPPGNDGPWVLEAEHAPTALWRRAIVELSQELTGDVGRAAAGGLKTLLDLLGARGRGEVHLPGLKAIVRGDLKPARVSLHLKKE